MTRNSNPPELPHTTQEKLVALKGTNSDEFYALVKALRVAKWPLRAIAAPFSVSRTAVQGWEKAYDGRPLPDVPPLPAPEESKTRPKSSKKAQLSPTEASALRELAQQASKVRRYTDPNAESRSAASKLEALLIEYTSRGVTRTQLAEYCGVSDSSIKQRLRKYS